LVTWAFVLEGARTDSTRLVVRVRGGLGYPLRGMPRWLAIRVMALVHFIMQRKQLIGIATRAELTPPSDVVVGPEHVTRGAA
jgi:hypothetical protein